MLDADAARVLLVRAPGGGWGLPGWDVGPAPGWGHAAAVAAAAGRVLGAELVVLRPLFSEQVGGRYMEVHELDLRTPPAVAVRWGDVDEVAPDRRALVAAALEARCTGVPFPWAQPGWLDEAAAWTRERLGDEETRIDQIGSRSISAVLRATTSRGRRFYFKEVPAHFAREPVVTAELARAHRGYVPDVVAVDAPRRRMITADFGDRTLDDGSPDEWVLAVRRYAEIQVLWTGRVGDALALGAGDRRLEVLADAAPRVLSDEGAMLPGTDGGLTLGEIAKLPELAGRSVAACEQLAAAADLPPSIDHGDLHPGNVAVSDVAPPLVFDWTDAAVAHPFAWVPTFLGFGDVPAVDEQRLRGAYLSAWREFASPAALERAFELATTVGLIDQAVIYHGIVAATAPAAKWEFERAIPWIVRRLLAHVNP